MLVRIVRVVPDLMVSVRDVVRRGPREAMVDTEWSGTQAEPFLPIFPCRQFARWRVLVRVAFEYYGKVIRVESAIEPPPQGPPFEPSNLAALAQGALMLAATPSGSRLLQAGIAAADREALGGFLAHLRGHVWEIAASPHGNHVLQRYIAIAPIEFASFVAQELRGQAVSAATHVTRSRILERLLEHCGQDVTAPLAEELLEHIAFLAQDPFGNFVAQRMIEHGRPELRHNAAAALAPHAAALARHKRGNNVVRTALTHCALEDQRRLAAAVAAAPGGLKALGKHIVGCYVVRQMRFAKLV